MMILVVILACAVLARPGAAYSYLAPPSDYEAFSLEQPQQFSLTDWDSALYGKPICQAIPSNMSLCKNMNYRQMKVPNLLGHETTEEIVDQSIAWVQLVSANCHKDTQLFLCSLFAPVCVEHEQATIYPCRSLCESVKNSCEAPMLAYKYPWPPMFNCSRFPDNNGLCIQSFEQTSPTTTTTTTRPTTTTRYVQPAAAKDDETSSNVTRSKPRQGGRSNQVCSGCDSELKNLEQIVSTFCTSNIAIRARVAAIKNSNLDQYSFQSRRMHRNATRSVMSAYAVISRRDRRVFKGFKYLSNFAVNSYLKDHDSSSVEEGMSSKKLNVFLLSKYHLNICKANTRKAKRLRENVRLRVSRNADPFAQYKPKNRPTRRHQPHCKCSILGKNMHRQRYLIMANLMRTRSLTIQKQSKRTRNLKSNRFSRAQDLYEIIGSAGKDSSAQPRRKSAEETPQLRKLIYVTGVVKWHRARAFIDYLEDDSIDKSDMCLDIKETVRAIKRDAKERF